MTEPLLSLALKKPPTVEAGSTVREAVRVLTQAGTGAICVLRDCRIVGIFSERDLLCKVVDHGRDPDRTPVSDVMAPAPTCVTPDTGRSEAVRIMIDGGFRHLPIADESGCLIGIVSQRDLFGHQLTRLRDEINSLELYMCADGPGG